MLTCSIFRVLLHPPELLLQIRYLGAQMLDVLLHRSARLRLLGQLPLRVCDLGLSGDKLGFLVGRG